ncbi:hypothetical protein JW796_00550 [Candidatus Dojkabacteria bacterium]|nr:hypothetical protein [Candidatus Dojkabacteria bacterium]
MSKKVPLIIGFLVGLGILLTAGFFLLRQSEFALIDELIGGKTSQENEEKKVEPGVGTKSMMILIEYKDTVGLVNFANEMKSRDISGLLLVSPDFVEKNCEAVKEVIKYDIEIIGSNPKGVFWDVPYEEQYTIISDMKKRIETCTGEPLRIVGSMYMASDENTVKAAQELGIPYVIARGTTDTKATVYKPEEYDVKILSISNIALATFKFGSLCDYSFYERSGTPQDMLDELGRAYEPMTEKEIEWSGKFHRVTPTTHTNIGGYLKPWMDMWIEFWDTNKTEWVGLDEFMEEIDWNLPMWQIPTNRNAPYTPEKIRPLMPYDEIEKVENPCRVEDIGKED